MFPASNVLCGSSHYRFTLSMHFSATFSLCIRVVTISRFSSIKAPWDRVIAVRPLRLARPENKLRYYSACFHINRSSFLQHPLLSSYLAYAFRSSRFSNLGFGSFFLCFASNRNESRVSFFNSNAMSFMR